MSAPEPQVRVDGYWYECDGCGVRTRPWGAEVYPEKVGLAADAHAETCAPLKLARLQAHWDARDEAESALIGRWRTDSENWLWGIPTREGRARGLAADELERAIGGGKS